MLLKEIKADKLKVEIYDSRDAMGFAAGTATVAKLRELLAEKDEVNMIFTAAPSQNETLDTLCKAEGIDWSRVNAFHMDEYIGLSPDAPQCFGNFLREHIFAKLPFKNVYYIAEAGKTGEEICETYTELLKSHKIDIVCLGIGENGHIAFNDPWVADFSDPVLIKRVPLDPVCRQQQVNDGCFAKLEDVPEYALTLTVPALTAADYLYCTVPAKTKAEAVYNTIYHEIGEAVPATSMRLHDHAVMYCDKDSGEKVF